MRYLSISLGIAAFTLLGCDLTGASSPDGVIGWSALDQELQVEGCDGGEPAEVGVTDDAGVCGSPGIVAATAEEEGATCPYLDAHGSRLVRVDAVDAEAWFSTAPGTGDLAICPVTGIAFEVHEDSPISKVDGRYYAFTCAGAQSAFDVHPWVFLEPTEQGRLIDA